MGSEKLQQYFQPNTRSTANDELTGERRVLVRRYQDIHLQRFQISPTQVRPTLPVAGERNPETDIWLPPAEAKRLVDSGVAMFVKNQHGEIVTDDSVKG